MGTEFSDSELESLIDRVKETKSVKGSTSKKPSKVIVIEPAEPLTEEKERALHKQQTRNEDKLIRTMQGNVSDPHILATAAQELAEEIFALKFERQRLEVEGKDITQAAGKRVIALKALIDTSLKLKELTREEPVDFNSVQMQVIIRLLFTKIQESLKSSGYSGQDIQTFFQVFQTNMETFQVEAQRDIDLELGD